MKAVDFSRVIEYYIHLNNASITPILLTSIQHLVTPPPPPHTQDVSQPAQLQSALIYLVLARCNDSCRNAETVTSLVASVRQLLAQRPAVVADLLERLFGSFTVPQSQLPALLDVLRDVLPAGIHVPAAGSASSSKGVESSQSTQSTKTTQSMNTAQLKKTAQSTHPGKEKEQKGSDYADVTASLQTLAATLTPEQQDELLKALKKVLRHLAKSNLSLAFWRALCGLGATFPATFGGAEVEAWVAAQLRENLVSALVVEAIDASAMGDAVKQALEPSRAIYAPLAAEEEAKGVSPIEAFLQNLKVSGEHKRQSAARDTAEENAAKRPCYAGAEIVEVRSRRWTETQTKPNEALVRLVLTLSFPVAGISGPALRSLTPLSFLSLFQEDLLQFHGNRHLFAFDCLLLFTLASCSPRCSSPHLPPRRNTSCSRDTRCSRC